MIAARGSALRDGLFIAALAFVVAVASFLHLWRLGAVPAGFYVDESSIAYNAYSIAKTGADEYGVEHPLFFRSFDNYQDPVMVYSVVPLVNAFELTERMARLPSALFALLAAAAFALLAYEYTGSRWFALLGGGLFAIVPWAFPISRTVMAGYTPMLFGVVLGCWLLLVALRRASIGVAILAGIVWAFAMYAHNIGRPIIALLLVAFALSRFRRVLNHRRLAVAFLFGFGLALAPMIASVLDSSTSLTARFGRISIFADDPTLTELVQRFSARYAEYFGPAFLFVHGDTNLRHHTGLGGELYWFLLPLIVAGLYVLIRACRQRPDYRFLLLGLLVTPIAAALTMERMHGTRSLVAVIFWLLAAVIGAQFLWRQGKLGRLTLAAVCLVGAVESGRYLGDYFGDYQMRCSAHCLTPVTEAIRFSFDRLAPEQTLYVSPSIGSPIGHVLDRSFKPLLYAHLAFYGKVDPHAYQGQGFPAKRIRYYDGSIANPGLLIRCNAVLARLPNEDRIVAAVNPEPLPPQSQLIHTISAGGPMYYEIYDVPSLE